MPSMGAHYTEHLERTVERQSAQIAAIKTVVTNIENTIAGKQKLLDDLSYYSGTLVNDVTQQFLKINVDELKRILSDLKQVEAARG